MVTKVISPVVYHLQLPPSWKVFDTFHVSLLSPYKEMEQHGTNFLKPPSEVVEGTEEYEVKAILGYWVYGRWKKKQYLVKWKGYSDAHNSWEPVENVNALDLVKSYLNAHPIWARQTTYNQRAKPYQRPMPIRRSNCLSTTEQIPITFSSHIINGIQQAAEGLSPSHQLWFNNSSPYMLEEACAEAHRLYAQAEIPQHTYDASPQHFGTHLYTIEAELPEDVHTQEEWCDALAVSSSAEGLSGVDEMSDERAAPKHPGDAIFAFDKGDFLDLPLGGGGPDSIKVGDAQEGPGTQGNLDRREQNVEGNIEVEFPRSSYTWASYSPYNHSEGDCLHSPADPMMD